MGMKNSTHRTTQRILVLVAAFIAAGQLGGCSSSAVYNGQDYTLESGSLAGADRERIVAVARDVLTDHRFVIDRVDGRRGVVTTEFKTTQGFVSPWDGEQGSLKEEAADFVNQHERSVRVMIDDDGSVVVSVMVQRVHRPGWRIETESISSSTRTTIIGPDGWPQDGRMTTPIGHDGQLARRIGQDITKRLTDR